jgi:large subunit ribosomal protein L30
MKLMAVIRIRGSSGLSPKVRDTLEMLNLGKVNHCTVIPYNDTYKGMLQRAKDYLTWGEVSQEELTRLLEKKSRLQGNQKPDQEYLKKNTKAKDWKHFSQMLLKGDATLKELPKFKKFFRLNPPKGGFKSVKVTYVNKGDLGYRGEAINELLDRMVR